MPCASSRHRVRSAPPTPPGHCLIGPSFDTQESSALGPSDAAELRRVLELPLSHLRRHEEAALPRHLLDTSWTPPRHLLDTS